MSTGAITLDQLLTLVKENCSKEHVQHLLRKTKKESPGKGVVRIEGSAERVVDQNLRDAIQTGALSWDDVYKLIEECEESGKQHIFYFRPKIDAEVDICRDADAFAEKLFGVNWREDRDFPRRHFAQSYIDWADYRVISATEDGGPGWIAKLYSGVLKQIYIRTERHGEGPEGRVHKVFIEKLAREVHLARWHPHGILELRVPLDATVKEVLNSVRGLWEAIAPAVSADLFEPIDLLPACRKIIDQHAANTATYRLGDAHFEDETEGSLRMSPKKPNQHLMDDDKRRQAVEILDVCRLLVVVWLLNEAAHDTKEELRTTIGKLRPNQLVLVSRTTEKALLHVIRQLRDFSA